MYYYNSFLYVHRCDFPQLQMPIEFVDFLQQAGATCAINRLDGARSGWNFQCIHVHHGFAVQKPDIGKTRDKGQTGCGGWPAVFRARPCKNDVSHVFPGQASAQIGLGFVAQTYLELVGHWVRVKTWHSHQHHHIPLHQHFEYRTFIDPNDDHDHNSWMVYNGNHRHRLYLVRVFFVVGRLMDKDHRFVHEKCPANFAEDMPTKTQLGAAHPMAICFGSDRPAPHAPAGRHASDEAWTAATWKKGG